MTTENDEWKPRDRNNDHEKKDGQNDTQRPSQPYNNPNNGNQTGNPGNKNNNYERRSNGYNPRPYNNYPPQRPPARDNRPGYNNAIDPVKKKRVRMGDTFVKNTGYNPNRQPGGNNYRQPGEYRPQRLQQYPRPNTPGWKPFNKSAYPPNAPLLINKKNKYREEHFKPDELIRLNKYLANAGICSRREADEFIQAGLVKVNGETVSELGTKVKRADEVFFHNEPVKLEQKVYVLLNKPRNCVTTADDPEERLTVMDLVRTACYERIFPVGRLDRSTTGVLLLTNDGDLAAKLTHPKHMKKKIYHVWLDKDVAVADMQKIAEGVELDDGEIHADAISYVTETDKDQVGVEIHSGKKRVIRRMFEALGYRVVKLDRVYFAGLTKKNLKRGHWRYLDEREVSMLRMGAFE
jgi:23S rRNA pseudouridine2605 synthase